MRQMIGLTALAETQPETLVKILAPVCFKQIVEGNDQAANESRGSATIEESYCHAIARLVQG